MWAKQVGSGGAFYGVVIDGPNFVNRIADHGHKGRLLSEDFHLTHINGYLQSEIKNRLGYARCLSVDFICSQKLLGDDVAKLSGEEQSKLLESFKHEPLTTVREIVICDNKEKGVDVAVASKLFELSDSCETLVLISSDKDYIPALEVLRNRGRYLVTMGFWDSHPIELINLSHIFFDLDELYFKREIIGKVAKSELSERLERF